MTTRAPRPAVRVRDLPDRPTPGVLLKCVGRCQGEYSACRGDYFMADPETIPRCCGRALILVRKSTQFAAVHA